MHVTLGRLFGMRRKSDNAMLSLLERNDWLPRDAPWYPEALELRPEDFQLLQRLRQELSDELEPGELVSDLDVLYFALQELACTLKLPSREDEVLKLLFYLSEQQQNLKFNE
jgi:hypothetical protein